MTWPVVPLGQVAETALGKMLDRGRSRGHAHVPYLRNVNVQWGRIDTDDLLTMELADDERERFGVREGDLLVCEGGEIGRCAIWRGREDYIAYQKALHRIRPSECLDTRFLRYLLEHHAFSGTLAGLSTGTTIAHLPQQQIRRVPVPLPPVEEQRRIVDLLEDHLSRLDAADAYLASVALRSTALQESWLGSRLPREHDCGRGPEWTTLGDVLQDVRGGWSRSRAHLVAAEAGVPYLKMNNITRRGRLTVDDLVYVAADDAATGKYAVREGDLLFNSKNSGDLIGKTAIVDARATGALINENIMRLRFKSIVVPAYAAMWFLAPLARWHIRASASASTNVAAVYQKDLVSFPIWTPSLSVQQRLVDEFEELRNSSERLLLQARVASSNVRALRRSVFDAAFSGLLTGGPSAGSRMAVGNA